MVWCSLGLVFEAVDVEEDPYDVEDVAWVVPLPPPTGLAIALDAILIPIVRWS